MFNRCRIALLLPTVFLLLLVFVFAKSAFAERPNVIVVMTDDQGYGEFSCHGNPIAKTTNIDALAAQSLRMTDFHAAPMCTPTRAQLMTGLDAFRTSAINVSSGRTLLNPKLKTMADVFGDAGYRTGIFGKWHLGDNYPFRPGDRGFQEALWFPSSHINSVPDFWDNDYFDDTYIHQGVRKKYSGYCTDVFFDEAMSWIDNDDEKPFFVYLPLNAAHYPWFAPEKYRDPIRKGIAAKPDVFAKVTGKGGRNADNLTSFLAMGANIDENMGRLDAFLKENGLFDNTIVVFLTDNGSDFGDQYYNAGMRGRKTQLWEGGHRVPCFLRYPGKVKPQDVNTLAHVQDLLPTLAGFADAKEHLPEKLDGDDWGPMLRGEQHDLEDRTLVINYSRMPMFKVTYTKDNPAIPNKNGAVVMWKSWRLVENKWLYDVAADPHQDKDVAADNPELVERLSKHLDDWWATVEEDVMTPQRVVIGNDAENPSLLTACEWLDVFIDQQLQIRLAKRKNGVWYLDVDQAGKYRFELRRYPKESGFALQESFPATKVTDGQYFPGKKMPIEKAKFKIGETELAADAEEGAAGVSFEVNLDAGPTELQTWFLDKDDVEITGAYYVYAERLNDAAMAAKPQQAEALQVEPLKAIPLIFDTDLGNDCDDVLAMGVIHSLQSRGECELLAVTTTKDHVLAAPFADAINTFYGRGDIPIGVCRNSNVTPDAGKFNLLAEQKDDGQDRYPHDLRSGADAQSAVELLRKTLVAQEDGSVVIAQVGFSTNLADLLRSKGDDISPMTGMELVKKKVKLLSIMAGAFRQIVGDTGHLYDHKEYNINKDIPSAQFLAQQWPTQIVWSGFEIGKNLTYPHQSILKDYRYVKHHPLPEAYTLYEPPPHDRPTWDLTSVLYAVRPDHDYFDLSKPGKVTVADNALTTFEEAEGGRDRYLILKKNKARATEALVQLSSQPPQATTSEKE